MPKKLQKYIFSKFRKASSPNPTQPTSKSSFSSPTCRILPRCRVPRTPSFSLERGEYVDYDDENSAAISDGVDRLMFDNFNSLYQTNSEQSSDGQSTRPSTDPSPFVGLPPKIKVFPRPESGYISNVDRFLIENSSILCNPPPSKNRGSEEKQRKSLRTGAFPKLPKSTDSSPKKASADSDLLFVSDVDRFLLENFDLLYNQSVGSEDGGDFGKGEEQRARVFFEPSRKSISSYSKLDRFEKAEEEEHRGRVLIEPSRESIDFCKDIDVSHSDRFFVRASRSSSLMEEAWLASTASDDAKSSMSSVTGASESAADSGDLRNQEVAIPVDSVAVLTRSVDPYDDFRRSIEEMVEARVEEAGEVDWDFMEELLLCYLNLNERGSHRYILGAFADIVASRKLRKSVSGEIRGFSGELVKEKGQVLRSRFYGSS